MLVVGFAAAFGLASLLSIINDDVILLIAAPILIASAIAYRRWRRAKRIASGIVETDASITGWWNYPRVGGQFMFIPIGAFGVFSTFLGAYQLWFD